MSAQAGILYRDGRPVPPEVLDTLSRFNRVLAPHQDGRFVSDGIAMLSFALHFDRLATQETQPVRRPDGSVLTWDGRLDNRSDFLLRLHSELDGPATDAALVALAMERWPDSTLEQLIGDWGLVRWDSSRRELLLARDYVGNRRLYYCCQPDYFAWSTSDDALVVICDLVGKLNERRLVGHVIGNHPPYETWYEGLLSVPAGCCLRITTALAPSITPHFRFSASTTRYRHQSEYGDRYRELLTEAVSVRLRSRTPVWTELSGGYDSSSVTCVASSLVSARAVEAPGLQLLSRVTPDSPESDESYYIEAVERWCRRQSYRERVDSATTFKLFDGDIGSESGRPISWSYVSPAEAAGSNVLLTGEFGDVAGGDRSTSFVLLDRLMSDGLQDFVRDSIAHCRYQRDAIFPLWWSVLLAAVRPANPREPSFSDRLALRAESRKLTDNSPPSQIFGLTDALFRRATPPRRGDVPYITDFPVASREMVSAVDYFATSDILAAFYKPSRLRRTHPFSHRPLVAFILSLPTSAFSSDRSSRSFVRRALQDSLPPTILNRLNKGYAAPASSRIYFPEAMNALGTGAMEKWELVSRQYADPSILKNIFAGFVDGSQRTSMLISGLLEAEDSLRRIRLDPEVAPRFNVNSDVA